MRILYVENHLVFAANVTRQFLSQRGVTVVPSLGETRQRTVTRRSIALTNHSKASRPEF